MIARAKFTDMHNKQEIKGYDALYFTKNSDGICLWLGQAKAGKKKYCTNSIADDLKNKYKTVALITKTQEDSNILCDKLEINLINLNYDSNINILPSYLKD